MTYCMSDIHGEILKWRDSPFEIFHAPGLIGIDCGCGNETDLRRLACLRLEDMREFYV